MYFPMNFASFYKNTFFIDHLRWLRLNLEKTFYKEKNSYAELVELIRALTNLGNLQKQRLD